MTGVQTTASLEDVVTTSFIRKPMWTTFPGVLVSSAQFDLQNTSLQKEIALPSYFHFVFSFVQH